MLKIDILDDQIPSYAGGPIRWAQLWSLLITDPRELSVLLAHVNYCDDAELAQLAASHVSVAYCPRTHEFFNHPPHPYRAMLAAGINVCLGTDSLASSPDLSLMREAQLLFKRDGMPAPLLLEMITCRGAQALGLQDQVGTLTAGKLADLIVMPGNVHESVGTWLGALFTTAAEPTAVWIAGQPVHP